jgi:hypothetical protein
MFRTMKKQVKDSIMLSAIIGLLILVSTTQLGDAQAYTINYVPIAIESVSSPTPTQTPQFVDYCVNASAGAGGTINPSGIQFAYAGASMNFTITPDAGYQISAVTDNGVSKGALTSYKLQNIREGHEIMVTFTAISTVTPTPTQEPAPDPTSQPTATPTAVPAENETPSPTPTPTTPELTVVLLLPMLVLVLFGAIVIKRRKASKN